MQCSQRSTIYVPDKLSGGKAALSVPCSVCIQCRINKTTEWALRCVYENEMHSKACFITLTYADEFLPENASLVKKDLQDFYKRVRKYYAGNSTSEIKYYCCGEYGPTTLRPHYHIALFGADFEPEKWKEFKKNHYFSSTLLELWPFGFNEIGFLSPDRMNYVAGYIQKKLMGRSIKQYVDRGVIPPFSLSSKHFGEKGMEKDAQRLTQLYVTDRARALPKYYTLKLGLKEIKSPDGFSLAQLRYLEENEKERSNHPELNDFEYAKLLVSKRQQEALDIEQRLKIFNSRGNL